MDFDVKVVCSKCGREVEVRGSEQLRDKFGYRLRVKPCANCQMVAKESGREEVHGAPSVEFSPEDLAPIAGAGPLKHRSYLRPAPDEIAAEAEEYKRAALGLIKEVEAAKGDKDKWQGPYFVKAQIALVYATLALEASTFFSRYKKGGK